MGGTEREKGHSVRPPRIVRRLITKSIVLSNGRSYPFVRRASAEGARCDGYKAAAAAAANDDDPSKGDVSRTERIAREEKSAPPVFGCRISDDDGNEHSSPNLITARRKRPPVRIENESHPPEEGIGRNDDDDDNEEDGIRHDVG